MSNELVYGDASKFVNELSGADAEARAFFDSVVTYLSACVKALSSYREASPVNASISADAWLVTVDTQADQFKIASRFANLVLLRSFPLGTVRFLLTETTVIDSDFHPRRVEGFLVFTGKDLGKAEAKNTDKKSAVKIHAGEGILPAGWKTDSPEGFAEPLFHQLFEPLPVEVPRANSGEGR
jgi:hypothetical protein